jgi:hypothetical protein
VQDCVFVVVGEMFVVDDPFDLVLAVFVVDLVRKVAEEHERLIAHRFDPMMQCLLSTLAADENPAGLDMPADI